MSFENKGSMTAAVVVTAAPDRSGNFVIEAGDDPAVVIETAWAFLNTFGGGTLVLKGAGQTWTLTTRIDSQGDHVTLISDHGLLLASTGAFGMIYVTNDDVKIDGLRMSMTTATARQEEMISFVSVQDAVVENCHLTGPDLERVAGDGYGIYFEDVLYGLIRGNYVDACQEAGIKLIQCGEDYGSGYIIIDENELYNTRRHGIMVQKSTDITIGDNISIGRNVGITKDGIHLSEDNERITITGNVCRYNGNAGICFAGVGDGGTWCVKSGTIAGNTCSENLMYGISVDTSENISIGDNTIRETAGNTYDIYISGVCQHIVIDGNTIYGASDGSRYHITVLEESDWVTISNNSIESARTEGFGIWLYEGDHYRVSGNTIEGKACGIAVGQDGNTLTDIIITDNMWICAANVGNPWGIWVDGGNQMVIANNLLDCASVVGSIGVAIEATGGDDILIEDNIIMNPQFNNIKIWDGDDIVIRGNRFIGGIQAIVLNGAAVTRCDLSGGNNFESCGTPLVNGGTDTILASKPFQFIKELNGDYLTTSPTGIEIDADTEGAILQGHIPVEVQQVVRIRVFAVALDGPIDAGGQMHLEFTFNSGVPNAAYNTAATSWTLANHNSEEADYIANDVITWVVEDADVGTELLALAAGNWFDLIVTHEAGADPDGATDAVFGSISLEYV